MHCCEEASEIKVLYVFCKNLYVIKVLFRFRRKIKNKIILILLLLYPSFSKNYKLQASNSSTKSNGNAKFSTFIYLFVMITSVYFFFLICAIEYLIYLKISSYMVKLFLIGIVAIATTIPE